MVRCNDQIEWRSPDDALKLDLSLVEHVFRRLARQRQIKSSEKSQDTQEPHVDTDEHDMASPPPPHPQAPIFHPDMLFSKSDVLVTLEQCHGFLQKRPLLRMLHTSLACVSIEREGASVEGFVRFRVKERTLSFAMARERLHQIHTHTQRAIELENQVQEFAAQARARSRWCVRDWKSVHRSPSQFYKVHVLPVRPKTQQQLDAERHALQSVAAGVVANVLRLGVEKLVDESRAKARAAASGRRSARSRTPHAPSSGGDAASRKSGARSDPALRAKARKNREQAEAEARRRELRLQIFIPAIQTSTLLSSDSEKQRATPTSVSSGSGGHATLSMAAATTADSSDGDAVANALDGGQDSELRASSGSGTTSKRAPRTRLLLLLAAAEANGDTRIAERLAAQKITRLGFQRALEQATNLGLAREDYWGLLKIWKSVYRAHALQSLTAAFAPHK